MLIHNALITGSLSVNGTGYNNGSFSGSFSGAVAGTTATASYVEYNSVANKPALVSGSSQITYSGLTGIPSGIVSGSAQVEYSGLTGIPSGIVSGSAQVSEFGIFATTGSNGFNGSQSITGSLTVTGQVVAQTLNVQQVTSSVVYSSGSNIFGNSLGNTQQFTGSVGVTGSLTVNGTSAVVGSGTTNYIPKFTAGSTIGNSVIQESGSNIGIGQSPTYKFDVNNVGGSTATTRLYGNDQANVRLRLENAGAGGRTYEIVGGLAGANNSSFSILDVTASATRFTIASTGAATFSNTARVEGQFLQIVNSTDPTLYLNNVTVQWQEYIKSNNNLAFSDAVRDVLTLGYNGSPSFFQGGNVGVGTTSPAEKLTVYTGTNYAAAFNTTSIESTTTRISLGALTTSGGGTGGSAAIGCEHYHAGTSNSSLLFYTYGGSFAERMRISPIGNVGIGTTSPDAIFHVARASSGGVGGQVVIDNPASSALGNTVEISFLTDAGASGAGTRNARILAVNENAGNGAANMQFHTWDGSSSAERMRITSGGTLAIGTTDIPTLSTPSGGQLTVMPNAVIVSGIIALGSPYTQNIQIDVVYNNWGGNNVIGLVDMIITLREYANTSGTAFGKIFATNSSGGATFASFNTTDVTTSQCSVTAVSGGNYTLRITIDPSNVTDRGSFYLTIPNAGGTGSSISSITVSYV